MQTKVQKHQNFEAELEANKNRIESITQTAQQLIDEDHYASETIQYVEIIFSLIIIIHVNLST